MILGTFFLIGALLALLVASAATLSDIARGGDPKKRDLAIMAGWTGTGLIGAALALLAGAFLAADIQLQYVWENVKTHYSWFERLSGLWVGRAGSLLLWTGFIAAFWSLEELRHRRAIAQSDHTAAASAVSAHHNPRVKNVDEALADTEKIRRVARLAVYTIAIVFLIIVLYGRPFAGVDPASLAQSPEGRGINPQLLIWYNAIHPPIVFLGYAATALPAAFALSHLVSGRPGWLGAARRWAHIAFVMLTIGVALGALWAYIALGWGGYWDWDPVEVASLVPWIITVAFLHAAYRNDGKQMFPVAAPLLGMLVFAGTLFSTLVVRSGVWVSLHSFIAEGDAQNPLQRYLSAIEHPEVMLFSILIAAILVFALVFASVQARRLDTGVIATPERPRPKARDSPSWSTRLLSHLDLHNLFLAGVLLLVLLATVTVTLLFVGINGFPSTGIREQIYTQRTGPVALTAVMVMAVAISIGTLPRKTILGLLAASLGIGLIAALFLPDLWALALAVPVLAFAAAMAGVRVVMAWRRMPRWRAVRFMGIHTIHLGVAVLLLGHGIVSTFDTTEGTIELREGETRPVGPYEVTLVSIETATFEDTGRVGTVVAHLLVTDETGKTRSATAGFQYFDFLSHYKPNVGVLRTLGNDVYLAPSGIHDPNQGWIFGNLPLHEQGSRMARSIDAINIEVSTLPMINMVWGGTFLMIVGGSALSVTSWNNATLKDDPRSTPRPQKEPAPSATAPTHKTPDPLESRRAPKGP